MDLPLGRLRRTCRDVSPACACPSQSRAGRILVRAAGRRLAELRGGGAARRPPWPSLQKPYTDTLLGGDVVPFQAMGVARHSVPRRRAQERILAAFQPPPDDGRPRGVAQVRTLGAYPDLRRWSASECGGAHADVLVLRDAAPSLGTQVHHGPSDLSARLSAALPRAFRVLVYDCGGMRRLRGRSRVQCGNVHNVPRAVRALLHVVRLFVVSDAAWKEHLRRKPSGTRYGV